MTDMRIVRRETYRRMPWKNGQGLTEEVAVMPEGGGGIDGFDWRLSIAHVDADGPFSLFPGIDRTIALLDGEGLALDLPEGRAVALTPSGAPFAFPGDWAIASRNLGGPTIDLNIMTRRGRCTHAMRRLTLAPGESLAGPETGWAVFNTPATIELEDGEHVLARFDAIAFETGGSLANRGAAAEILLIAIDPAA